MKKLLTAALLCSAALAPAMAQNYRYYGAADYGIVNFSGPGSYSNPGAISVSGGYHYLPNVDFEAGVTMIGSASADVPGPGRVSVNHNIFSAVAIGKLPLGSNVNLFGKAGLGLHDAEINGIPDDLVYGFGAQFLIDRQFAVRVQYESLGRFKVPSTSSKADVTRMSVGLTYNF